MARWSLTRADVLRVVLFLHRRGAERTPSLPRALFDYVRGLGPAAIAAGRLGVRCVPAAGS